MKQTRTRSSRNAAVRRLLLLGVLLAGIVLAGAGWYGWRWYTTPVPPAVSLEGAEPDVVEAIESARRNVVQDGRSAPAWGHLGQVLRAHGFDDASDVCFAHAERLDPKEPRWPYLQGVRLISTAPDDALPFLRHAVDLSERSDSDNVAPRFRLAETLLQVNALDEASEHLDRLFARDPDSPRVRYDLGLLAVARHDDNAAIDHFTRAAQSRDAQQRAFAQLAAIYTRRGDPAAAEFSERASHSAPDSFWPDPYVQEYMRLEVGQQRRLMAAEGLEAEGRLAEAAQLFRDISLQYSGDRSQVAEGISLAKLGQYEEAEKVLREALQRSPDLVQAHYFLGFVLYSQGERLLKQTSRDDERTRSKFREAAGSTRRATELKPDHSLAYVYLGLSLRQLGRRDEAIAALRMSVHCRPDLIDPHLYLGETLAEAGQREEAITSLERAVALSPEFDPRARKALERVREKDKDPNK